MGIFDYLSFVSSKLGPRKNESGFLDCRCTLFALILDSNLHMSSLNDYKKKKLVQIIQRKTMKTIFAILANLKDVFSSGSR